MCGCLKAEHQVAVGTGGHPVVHVAPPPPVYALPGNFNAVTVTEATPARMIVDAVHERTVSVLTSLNPTETDMTPMDQKHSHQCYFGPTTWIISDVFRPAGHHYGLNQAVLRQLQLAQAANPQGIGPTDAPTLIIIKHCINPQTSAYLKRVAPGSSQVLQAIDAAEFSATVFGKFITRLVPDLGAGNGAVQDVRYRSQPEDIYIRIQYG
jgi:hypothetical protein